MTANLKALTNECPQVQVIPLKGMFSWQSFPLSFKDKISSIDATKDINKKYGLRCYPTLLILKKWK
jgi:hypothetical protein